jgi:hypothetical protein
MLSLNEYSHLFARRVRIAAHLSGFGILLRATSYRMRQLRQQRIICWEHLCESCCVLSKVQVQVSRAARITRAHGRLPKMCEPVSGRRTGSSESRIGNATRTHRSETTYSTNSNTNDATISS